MSDQMLTNARRELACWETLVVERGAVAKAAREAHDEAIAGRDKWIELVKSIEADMGVAATTKRQPYPNE